MDELEKKRRQLADPDQAWQEIEQDSLQALSDEELQKLKSSRAFEEQLAQAMAVPVPENLAEKVLLDQRLNRQNHRVWAYALAASLFALSLFGWMQLNSSPPQPMTAEALEHVYHELDYLEEAMQEETLSLETVRKRLANMQLSVKNLPLKIMFASKCGFAGDKAMHIIAEVNGEPVTLLITKLPVEDMKRFGDEKFVGQMRVIDNTHLIAVAESPRLIDELFSQLQDA